MKPDPGEREESRHGIPLGAGLPDFPGARLEADVSFRLPAREAARKPDWDISSPASAASPPQAPAERPETWPNPSRGLSSPT